MPQVLKKTVFLFVGAFLIFFMLTDPGQFADVVQSLVDAVGTAFEQIGDFFSALIE